MSDLSSDYTTEHTTVNKMSDVLLEIYETNWFFHHLLVVKELIF